jgi:uncharacterized phage protein (TIGR01671 family)
MREIKFRVWDDFHKKYLIKLADIRMNMGTGELHGYKSSGNVPYWITEQYTGLKDKNGKEIYEGDIITTESRSTFWYSTKKPVILTQVIKWKEENTGWNIITIKDIINVIGNIHENKELLEG